MENDQEVAVICQLNLNKKCQVADRSTKSSFSSSIKDLAVNNFSLSPQNHSGNNNSHELDREYEFIIKHAKDFNPKMVRSLLLCQINNPNRLETVMWEVLKIPNALDLIHDFKKSNKVVGDKRLATEKNSEPVFENKKKRTSSSESYLNQLQDMFPDADQVFLINECQLLKNREDFSRFINTVMINGVYPKKKANNISVVNGKSNSSGNQINGENNLPFDESISSTIFVDLNKKPNDTKGKSENSLNSVDLFNESILYSSDEDASVNISEVIDITENSDTSKLHNETNRSIVEVVLDNSDIFKSPKKHVRNTFYDYTPKNEFFKNFNHDKNHSASASSTPTGRRSCPKLSTLRTSSSLDNAIIEKSVAQIIEERRPKSQLTQMSPNVTFDDFLKPSTSYELSSYAKYKDTESSHLRNLMETKDFNNSDSEVSSTTPTFSQENFEFSILEDCPNETSKINEEWLNEQTANLIRIFPNTDPSYLREEVSKMNMSAEAVNEFVIAKLEKNDMPTRAEYEKKQEMEKLQNRYTKNFSIDEFLLAIPDPWKYFSDKNRNCGKYKGHSLCYLKSVFKKYYVRDIIDTFNKNEYNLYASYKELKEKKYKLRGTRRSDFECNNNRPTTIDIQFLQEVAFIENEEKIREFLENEKIARQIKFEEAKLTGSLLECQCCFDSEVMVEDTVYCPKDHSFCKDCVIKCVEVEMGNGKCRIECLTACGEKFHLSSLKNALKPELFSKLVQAIQLEEIKAAEIEDLVQCPFCNYATIMPPEEKVLVCLNPECLKESCRLCRELNHIPLRCDEVEKSEDVKMRTFIENKMTEALVRTCYKCGQKFVKEDGCNKMTCTCGAKMCYVCRKPVTDYTHFNGQGGTEYHKCPLYSTNDELHIDLVKQIGERAKAEILQANPQGRLLHDPTTIMPEKSHDIPMPGINNGMALNFGLQAVVQQAHDPNPRGRERDRRLRRPDHIRREHHRHQTSDDESDSEDIVNCYINNLFHSPIHQVEHHRCHYHRHRHHHH